MTDTIVGYDTLTYVHTKNYAMDELAEKFTTDADFYLVMIDADRFKYINDNFGHLEGDRTLSVIGNMLNEVCKDHVAVPARFGGDEFCIISDFEPSAIIGELREKIAKANTEILGSFREKSQNKHKKAERCQKVYKKMQEKIRNILKKLDII